MRYVQAFTRIPPLLLTTLLIGGCGGDDEGPSGPSGPTTGSIEVSLVMSGSDMDANGCTFTVDSGSTQRLNSGENATFSDLSTGAHVVAIEDVAGNCQVDGEAARSVVVIAGQAAQETFTVVCDWTTRIAFTSRRDDDYEIYVMNPDGSDQVNLTNLHPAGNLYPTWSPDGTRIAFQSHRDDDAAIYVMNADGSNQVNLTNHPVADQYPAWSPDGTRIAFQSHRDDDAAIYVMNADGSDQVNLTNHPVADQQPAWSPDGTRIAFTSYRDNDWGDIYVMNADGSNQVNLTNHPGLPGSYDEPAWSPDGTQIAFSYGDRSGNQEIYAMNADGSNQVRLTNELATDDGAAWSPYLY